MVDGLLEIRPEAAPNSDVSGTLFVKFTGPPFVDRLFFQSITVVLTPPWDERLAGVTSGDALFLGVLIALFVFDKSSPSVLGSAIVVPLLGIVDSTLVNFVVRISVLVGEIGSIFLCDGGGNDLGLLCGTAAGWPGSVEPFTPRFDKVPIFSFVESKSLGGDATPPFTISLCMD